MNWMNNKILLPFCVWQLQVLFSYFITCVSSYPQKIYEWVLGTKTEVSHWKEVTQIPLSLCFSKSREMSFKFLSCSLNLSAQIWAVYWGAAVYWGGAWFKAPPPKKRSSFDNAGPNSQFHGKYISNNLIRIQVSLICKWVGPPARGYSHQICSHCPVWR
jgi:hypothetical protein